MVHTLADEFAAEVQQLCATPVSPGQWQAFLDQHVPRQDRNTRRPLNGRALTLAQRRRETLEQLYRHDPRVAPWAGTAHGVLQAVNTYDHHQAAVRGDRSERNNLRTITGGFGELDRRSWRTLQPLLNAA